MAVDDAAVIPATPPPEHRAEQPVHREHAPPEAHPERHAEQHEAAEPAPQRRSWLGTLHGAAGAAIRIGISVTGALLVVLVLIQIAFDTFYPTIDIKPVPVPAALERAGYRADVVSLKLADEIDRIQKIAPTGHRRRTLYFDRPPLDLTMPGLGFSVSSISNYIKSFLSLQEVIVCDITGEDGQYVMNIRDRKTRNAQTVDTVKNKDLDALIADGAKDILRQSDPYVLASFTRTSNPEQAKLLLREVIDRGDPEDVAWAYLMWGVIVKVNEHNIPDGLRYYQMAVDAFRAIPWYRRWFMSKDVVASAYVNMSIAYHDEEKPAESTRYLMRAVALGLDNAELTLGERYLEGFGVPRDPKAAEKWLLRATAQGRPEAYYRLALLYLGDVPNTPEIPRDARQGIARLRYAAAHGFVEAEERLGEEYLSGKNLPRDVGEAKYWLGLAADKGNGEAKKQLAVLAP